MGDMQCLVLCLIGDWPPWFDMYHYQHGGHAVLGVVFDRGLAPMVTEHWDGSEATPWALERDWRKDTVLIEFKIFNYL